MKVIIEHDETINITMGNLSLLKLNCRGQRTNILKCSDLDLTKRQSWYSFDFPQFRKIYLDILTMVQGSLLYFIQFKYLRMCATVVAYIT